MGRGVGAVRLRCDCSAVLPMRLLLFSMAISLVFCGEVAFSSAPEQESVLSVQLPSKPVSRLEYIYLHEFTATIMKTTRHYAFIAGRMPDLGWQSLQRFDRCQAVFTALQPQREALLGLGDEDKIDSFAYFEHLLMLSLSLAHMNRKLYDLGQKRAALQRNFMRSVTDKNEVQQSLKAVDDKIALLDGKIDTIFAADPANMLLTVKVGQPKQPLYQKIVADYYHALSMEVVGPRLIKTIQEANQPLLDRAWEQATTRNKKFLHHAWQHTCGERRLQQWLRPPKFAGLGFYIKHRDLVTHVKTKLEERKDRVLLEAHAAAENYLAEHIAPENFHSSASSFFGMLGALTLPAFLVPSAHNKYTLPVMGLAGLLYTGYRTKALYDMRHQLETGALSGLNSYNLYHNFRSNTSLSRTIFSHLSITALAMVLRKIPKKPAELTNVNTKLLVTVGTIGSLSSMLIAETVQTGNVNFLKDRDFLYNLFIVAAIDFTIISLASPALALSYESRVALTAAASVLLSVTGHIISGKEVNWDRIIFDTSYVSTYSLFKAKYFYTNGTHFLTEKLKSMGVNRKGIDTAVASVMALMSNFAGNVPYAVIARRWVERQPDYHKFPLPKGQQSDEMEHIDLEQHLEQHLDHMLNKHGIEDDTLKQILRQWLLSSSTSQ